MLILVIMFSVFLLERIIQHIKDIIVAKKTYKLGFDEGVQSATYVFENMKHEIKKHPDYLQVDLYVTGLINRRS